MTKKKVSKDALIYKFAKKNAEFEEDDFLNFINLGTDEINELAENYGKIILQKILLNRISLNNQEFSQTDKFNFFHNVQSLIKSLASKISPAETETFKQLLLNHPDKSYINDISIVIHSIESGLKILREPVPHFIIILHGALKPHHSPQNKHENANKLKEEQQIYLLKNQIKEISKSYNFLLEQFTQSQIFAKTARVLHDNLTVLKAELGFATNKIKHLENEVNSLEMENGQLKRKHSNDFEIYKKSRNLFFQSPQCNSGGEFRQSQTNNRMFSLDRVNINSERCNIPSSSSEDTAEKFYKII